MQVGVIPLGQSAIGALDLLLAGVAPNAEDGVGVRRRRSRADERATAALPPAGRRARGCGVVPCAPRGVRERLSGLVDAPHLLAGRRLGMQVGGIPLGQSAIGALDLLLAGVAPNAEDGVGIRRSRR